MKTPTILLVLAVLPCAISLTLEEEIPDNTLKVTFKDVSLNQWSSQHSSTIFREEVTNLTDTYCVLRSKDCSIQQYNQSNPITIDNVILSGFPVETLGGDLEIRFYVTLTGQTDITEAGPDHVIALDTLKEIILAGQSEMEQVMGYTMMYVDSTLVLPPLDHTMNIIMIPISCALLIIVIIVAAVLHCVEKRREDEMKPPKRPKSNSKVSPLHKDVESGRDMDNAEHNIQNNGEFSERKDERQKKKRKKEKRSKHSEDHDDTGEENYGYATTPRGETEKEYNIKTGSHYDNNFDKKDTKDYGKSDKSERHSKEYRNDDRYDSYDDHERSSRHRGKKKKHKHRGRRHRDESSETDPDVGYHQPPSKLPPLSEPNHATTEL